VDSSSPHEIATRIKDILRDYGQISKRALDHAERYDWRNISAEYARLYSDFG
jgi:glycosyltransferase involved in cell wall biosynthesis